jgi:hypothetical protein
LRTSIFPRNSKNVLPQRDESVPVAEPVQVGCCGKQITKEMMEVLAIEKYRANGKGITINDITAKYSVKKSKAQRSLKYFHSIDVLFTAQDLILEGISLLHNKNPQEYFATCMKAEILENLKKEKSVPVDATGVNLPKDSLYSLFNSIEHQKTNAFLEVLVALAYAPPYIHKLVLMFHLNSEFYNELKQREQPINRAKPYEENIGRRHVTYRLSPNGTVEVAVATTDTPFEIESDEDVSALFAFLGQVRDRLLYYVSDIKENNVPDLLNWILKQCDLNKDAEIDSIAQLTLPDIQLKSADRIFRLYVKIREGKAYCRGEESLTLNQALPEALDNIRHPYKSLEKKIDHAIQLLESESALGKRGLSHDDYLSHDD